MERTDFERILDKLCDANGHLPRAVIPIDGLIHGHLYDAIRDRLKAAPAYYGAELLTAYGLRLDGTDTGSDDEQG